MSKSKANLCAVFLFVVLCAITTCAFSQDSQIDLNSLTQETQKMSKNRDEATLVWWIPEQFWRTSFSQNPNMTGAEVEEFTKIIKPYILFVVVDGKIGSFGKVDYKSESDIKNAIKFIDSQANIYKPLADEEINADTKNLLAMIKPVFANMLGPMGQNMYFFLFPANNKTTGLDIIDAKKEGSFTVKLGERSFKWELPLASLLNPKTCPVCLRTLSGSYKFCPYDGTKLPE
jgi:hypothetical protein